MRISALLTYFFISFWLPTDWVCGQSLQSAKNSEVWEDCELDSMDGYKVYSIVDKPPKYEGGLKEFYSVLSENLRFRERDKQPGGVKVEISLVVDTEGRIRNICASNDLNVDQTLIDKLDNWTAGSLKGVKVPVRLKLPVHIRFG